MGAWHGMQEGWAAAACAPHAALDEQHPASRRERLLRRRAPAFPATHPPPRRQRLFELNPNQPYLSYEPRDVGTFIDSLPHIGLLV